MDEKIKNLIDEKSIISFDVFDTLLERRISNPSHVFTICENILVKRYGAEFKSYYHERLHAAFIATHCARTFHKEDSTIDSIMESLTKIYIDYDLCAKDLVEIELEIEEKLLIPRKDGIEIYLYAVSKGKTIYICSDMYLSEAFIKARLHEHGINKYDRIYVSGEVGLLKSSGKLFEWILIQNKILRDELLHIGDNLRSDVNMANKSGIEAYHLPQNSRLDKFFKLAFETSAIRPSRFLATDISTGLLKPRLISNNFLSQESNPTRYLYFLGYSLVGPIVLSLCEWIKSECLKKDIGQILFFSRDGEIVHKVFKQLYPDLSSEYCYASRRMTSYTAGNIEVNAFIAAFKNGMNSKNTIHDILTKLPCHEQLTNLYKKKYGISSLDDNCLPSKRKDLISFLRSNFKIIRESFTTDFEKVSNYYIAMCRGHHKVAVFDVGWKGNLQVGFERILKQSGYSCEVQGFYLGMTFDAVNAQLSCNWKGLLLNLDRPYDTFSAFSRSIATIEFLFSGIHPSVNSITKLSNGTYDPIYETFDLIAEKARSERAVVIHQSCQDFVSDFKKQYNSINFNSLVSSQNLSQVLIHFLNHPSKIDVDHFIAFSFAQGVDEGIDSPLIDWPDETYHPRKLWERLGKSLWRSGYNAKLNRTQKRLLKGYKRLRKFTKLF
jgi:predicted HAD superfamily hydrolase